MLLITLLATAAHAENTSSIISKLQNQATQQKLWQQSEWLNLLHFEGSGETPDDYKSSIRDKNFFLADDGSNNAETELLTTIAGLYDTELKDDQNPQCKYIARFNWLSKNLNIDLVTLPTVHCEKYIS